MQDARITALLSGLSPGFLSYENAVDFLYHQCMEIAPIDDDDAFRKAFEELEKQLEAFSLQENNQLFSTIEELCLMHSEKAFHTGFQMALKLYDQLQNLSKSE